MANANALQDKLMATFNAGDAPKMSKTYAKQLKKAALREALQKMKLEAKSAKVIPMKKPEAKAAKKTKPAPKKPSAKASAKKASPLKKAVATKKVARKTMKRATGRKTKKKSR